MTYLLWTVQVLLALIFLLAGGTKLALPVAALTKMMPLPGWFLRFTGTAEVLGALGLILPGLLRIGSMLTPLAGAGLVIVMAGATVFTVVWGGGAGALIPAAVGGLAGLVAYGRWRLIPLVARGGVRLKQIEA